MHFTGVAIIASMVLTATSHPHPEPRQTHTSPSPLLSHKPAHHTDTSLNTTLLPRAEKGICTDLELPTESSYKAGYESFCKNWVPAGSSIVMSPGARPLVVTSMLRSHTGSTIPWVFKINSEAWGYTPYYLRQEACLSGFRDMLEGGQAKLGRNFCVVDNTGGNGDSKEFWGQGFVLVMEQVVQWPDGDVNDLASFEARKRRD